MPDRRSTRGRRTSRSRRRTTPARRTGQPVKKRKIGRKILLAAILIFAVVKLLPHLDFSGLGLPFGEAVSPDSVAIVARDPEALRTLDAAQPEDSLAGEVAVIIAQAQPALERVDTTATETAPNFVERAQASLDALTDRLFQVREIDLSGVMSINEDTLRVLLGDIEGTPMFDLDLVALAKKLTAHPRVQEVQLVRRLPGSLDVVVYERRELAVVLSGGQLYGVDADGVVLSPPEPGWPVDAPLISGLNVRPEVGDTLGGAGFERALEWIDRASKAARVQSWVSEVRANETDVEWIAGVNGWRARPGMHPVGVQVAALNAYLGKKGVEQRDHRTLDLRFPGFLIVRNGS